MDGKCRLLQPLELWVGVINVFCDQVKAATAEAFGRGGGTQIEIVGPDGRILPERHHPNAASCDNGQEGAAMGCGDKRLDW